MKTKQEKETFSIEVNSEFENFPDNQKFDLFNHSPCCHSFPKSKCSLNSKTNIDIKNMHGVQKSANSQNTKTLDRSNKNQKQEGFQRQFIQKPNNKLNRNNMNVVNKDEVQST